MTTLIVLPAFFWGVLMSTIIPPMIVHPAYSETFLLLVALLSLVAVQEKGIVVDFGLVKPLLLYLFASFFVGFSIVVIGRGLSTGAFANLVVNGLFLLLLLVLQGRYNRLFTNSYLIFCLVMSVAGIAAFVLINFQYVDWRAHVFSLYDATGGRFVRELWSFRGLYFGYSFPYHLGLVLTGSYLYSFFNFDFYRLSGWLHEPTTAALFVTPAIILLMGRHFKQSLLNYIFLIPLVSFWLACASLGSAIALSLSFLYYALISAIARRSVKHWIYAGLIGGALVVVFFQLRFLIQFSTLVEQKLDLSRYSGGIIMPPHAYLDNIFLGLFSYLFLLILFWSATKSFRIGGKSAVYGFIALYLSVHGAKGLVVHMSSYPVTLWWVYLLFFEMRHAAEIKDQRVAVSRR